MPVFELYSHKKSTHIYTLEPDTLNPQDEFKGIGVIGYSPEPNCAYQDYLTPVYGWRKENTVYNWRFDYADTDLYGATEFGEYG